MSPAERVWLWAAVLVGAWLRLSFPDRMAVEHFDEAVYASNVLFGPESNYQYPFREFFAPPLLPAAIEWLHIAWSVTGRPSPDWLPMVPALLCGIATIPSLWWIARRWFSPHSGIAAAWLIALCEFHAAYSRTALTDVPLALFVLWAVYWFGRALESNSKWFAVLAGAFTAAAWWTKYNGWLPIAIAVTGAALVLLLTRAPRTAWLRSSAVCVIGTVLAAILWTPVLWDCEDVGGYAAVAANHRGYVEGWTNWLKNARLQFEGHGAAYTGWLTVVGVVGPTIALYFATAGLQLWWKASSSDLAWDGKRLFWLTINGAIAVVSPGSWFPLLIGGGAVCSALALRRATRDRDLRLALPAALVLVWVVSLVVATPLYHAYPRLTIPLIVGGVLAASIFWRRGWAPFGAPHVAVAVSSAAAIATLCVVLALVRGTTVWEDRSGYRVAAREMERLGEALWRPNNDTPAIVYTLAEPALFYQLRRQGAPAAISADTAFLKRLDLTPEVRIFVATGPFPAGSDKELQDWQIALERFTLLGDITAAPPSSIVRLDRSASERRVLDESARHYLLYRWNAAAAAPR